MCTEAPLWWLGVYGGTVVDIGAGAGAVAGRPRGAGAVAGGARAGIGGAAVVGAPGASLEEGT
jgi:hypothetical protein